MSWRVRFSAQWAIESEFKSVIVVDAGGGDGSVDGDGDGEAAIKPLACKVLGRGFIEDKINRVWLKTTSFENWT